MINFIATSKSQEGIISILGALFFGVIIILVLSYFHISIKTVVESPDTQNNVHYVGGASKSLWNDYLQKPASYLWNDIWLKLFWEPFIADIKKIRDTGQSSLENNAPTVNFR